jgi:hypothetical protein
VLVGWKILPILFTLECIEGEIVVDIKIVILTTFITYGGLIEKQIFEHVVCLGVDGVSMFQGVKFNFLLFF